MLLEQGRRTRQIQDFVAGAVLFRQRVGLGCRALPQFRGETEPELRAWLRQVLARVLAHEVRRYRGTESTTRNDDAFLVPGYPITDPVVRASYTH